MSPSSVPAGSTPQAAPTPLQQGTGGWDSARGCGAGGCPNASGTLPGRGSKDLTPDLELCISTGRSGWPGGTGGVAGAGTRLLCPRCWARSWAPLGVPAVPLPWGEPQPAGTWGRGCGVGILWGPPAAPQTAGMGCAGPAGWVSAGRALPRRGGQAGAPVRASAAFPTSAADVIRLDRGMSARIIFNALPYS